MDKETAKKEKEIVETIIYAAHRKGYSLEELSEKVGKHHGFLSGCRGKGRITLDGALDVCRALGIEIVLQEADEGK